MIMMMESVLCCVVLCLCAESLCGLSHSVCVSTGLLSPSPAL